MSPVTTDNAGHTPATPSSPPGNYTTTADATTLHVVALWIAAQHPRTPWYAKLSAGAMAAYALSPVDMIPDSFQSWVLDGFLIMPIGILQAIKVMPAPLMAEFRALAISPPSPGGSSSLPRYGVSDYSWPLGGSEPSLSGGSARTARA